LLASPHRPPLFCSVSCLLHPCRAPLHLRPPSSFQVNPRPPIATLFPYTTLFRSARRGNPEASPSMRLAAPNSHRFLISHEGVSRDRKSTRLNSSHVSISYAVFCLKKKTTLGH